jgi:gliding motility-associated-like protein
MQPSSTQKGWLLSHKKQTVQKLLMRKIVQKKILMILIGCCSVLVARQALSQPLLPYQPEQDACNAITLCSNTFYTPFSYRGGGYLYPEVDTYLRLGEAYERNSVWFRIKVATAGSIVFTITPVSPVQDYDFSVFNVTNLTKCPYTRMQLADNIIRYNLNCNADCNSDQPLYPGGKIGLDYTSQLKFVPGGTVGDPFLQKIDAQAGDEYLIMVNNFTALAEGFSISLDGSTANVLNDGLAIDSVKAVCSASANYRNLTVIFNEPVLCSSLAANGSDFTLGSGAPAVIAATGANCGQPGAYVRELTLTLDAPLQLGQTYRLSLKKGNDGNTVAGLCHGAEIPESYSKDFTISLPYTVNAGKDTTICLGGSIQLNANPQGVGDVRIRWQPLTYLNNGTIANPIATPTQDVEYIVTAAPVGFPAVCHHKDTIRVKVLKGFDIITPDTILCRPEKIPIQLRGDSAFTYTWSPPYYLSGTTGMLQNATPEKAIAYTVKATYPGCKDSVQTVNIGIRQWPQLITFDTIVCNGQPVPIEVLGGSNFSHVWSPDLYLSDAASFNPVATPASNIVYKVTTSYPGCADSVQSVSIGVEPLPDIAPMTFNTLCIGNTLQMLPSITPSGYANYSYKWGPAESFNHPGIKNAIYTASKTGQISLEVSTPHGCADTLFQLIFVSPLPVINAGRDITIVDGQIINLQGSVDQPATTIKWTPAQYLSNDNILSPTAMLSASQNFVFSVSNEHGCTAKDSVFITVLKNIHVPNAFSPNGDGINDVWNIPGLSSYPNAKTQVFNRWGQKVFESTGYAKPWNGTIKGNPLPIGVYYYLIKTNAEGYNSFSGSVTLIR